VRRIGLLFLLALAGCGGDPPSSVVPADATIYIGVDRSRAQQLLTGQEIDFGRDVEPWLGDRAAYFTRPASDVAGLVLDSEDDEAAEAFARKLTARGPYRASAIIDGHLVLTSDQALLRAVNASAGGEALADSARLDVSGEDGDDAPDIVIAAEEPRTLVAGLERMGVLPGEPPLDVEALAGSGPLTVRIWDELVEIEGLPPHQDTPPTLADVPGAAWLAFSSADLGESGALFAAHEQFRSLEIALRIDLERTVLPHLGAGMLFVQGRDAYDMGGRLVAEVGDEEGLRREVVALARRLGAKRAELHVNRPGAEPFLELHVNARDLEPFFLRLRDGRLYLDVGTTPGGVAEDLSDTRAYRDAARRLRGAPTLLLTSDAGYLAARDVTEDGRRSLRIVSGAGG
jgi:hypothetical protein